MPDAAQSRLRLHTALNHFVFDSRGVGWSTVSNAFPKQAKFMLGLLGLDLCAE